MASQMGSMPFSLASDGHQGRDRVATDGSSEGAADDLRFVVADGVFGGGGGAGDRRRRAGGERAGRGSAHRAKLAPSAPGAVVSQSALGRGRGRAPGVGGLA